MKKTYILLIVCLGFIFTSCQKEGTIYKPAADQPCISFPSEMAVYDMVAADGNKIIVEMNRGNINGALSVPVAIKDETGGVFVPEKTTFDFADGEGRAYITFNYPDINNFLAEEYKIVISVTDTKILSPSGVGSITVSAKRQLTWNLFKSGTYVSEFFGDWGQDLLVAEEAPYLFKFPDLYVKGTSWGFKLNDDKSIIPDGVLTEEGLYDAPTGYNHKTYGPVSTYTDPSVKYTFFDKEGGKSQFVRFFYVDAGGFGWFAESFTF